MSSGDGSAAGQEMRSTVPSDSSATDLIEQLGRWSVGSSIPLMYSSLPDYSGVFQASQHQASQQQMIPPQLAQMMAQMQAASMPGLRQSPWWTPQQGTLTCARPRVWRERRRRPFDRGDHARPQLHGCTVGPSQHHVDGGSSMVRAFLSIVFAPACGCHRMYVLYIPPLGVCGYKLDRLQIVCMCVVWSI